MIKKIGLVLLATASIEAHALTVFLGAGGGVDFYDTLGVLQIDNNSFNGVSTIDYDGVTQTGSANFSSGTGSNGISIYNASIVESSDGSMSLNGSIDVGASQGLFVDLLFAVDYEYFSDFDATEFSFYTIESNVCTNLAFCNSTSIGSIDFADNPSFLAFVGNPFPTYTPVPLPASIFMFIPAMCLLFSKKAITRLGCGSKKLRFFARN